MAIKEEQYDPGYEVAFGGAYGEPAPEGGQSNGFCNFSTSEEKGWYHFSSVEHKRIYLFVHTMKVKGVFRRLKSIFVFIPPADAVEKAPTNPNAAGQVQDGQWMTQSFADQIPDIGSSSQAQSWGV